MRALSLRDLLLADELSHIRNEVELIHPNNDAIVKYVLQGIGFDTSREINYEASYHRDMQGKAAVGFRVLGEYDTDLKYKEFLTTDDRVVQAYMKDVSLGKEMEILLGKRFGYKNEDNEYDIGSKRKKPSDPRYYSDDQLLEMGYDDADYEDYEEVDMEDELTQQIKVLEDIKVVLRGE